MDSPIGASIPLSAPPCAMPHVDSAPPRQSDAEWFAQEIQPLEASLRIYLRGRFPTLRDTDDLVQETFSRILRARAKGAVTSPKSMLFTIARNLAFDHFRHDAVVTIEALPDLSRLPVLDDRPGAAESLSREQEIELLREAVASLPTRCRRIVTLRKLYGLSYDEIGKKLGISINTVNSQVSTAIERCRAYLMSKGVTGERET
jgi:RNA polymerase sigma factor (sigma-70 family)